MAENPKYYIVEESALPEVFLRVAEVRRMLESGETAKVSDATRKVGISRSAYYKYKDSILPFQNLMAGRIITFQMTLRDEVGLLSQLLSCPVEVLLQRISEPEGICKAGILAG